MRIQLLVRNVVYVDRNSIVHEITCKQVYNKQLKLCGGLLEVLEVLVKESIGWEHDGEECANDVLDPVGQEYSVLSDDLRQWTPHTYEVNRPPQAERDEEEREIRAVNSTPSHSPEPAAADEGLAEQVMAELKKKAAAKEQQLKKEVLRNKQELKKQRMRPGRGKKVKKEKPEAREPFDIKVVRGWIED